MGCWGLRGFGSGMHERGFEGCIGFGVKDLLGVGFRLGFRLNLGLQVL